MTTPPTPHALRSEQRARQLAAHLGMWLFLASEVMMFASLAIIAGYYQLAHRQGVAEAVGHLHYGLAALNTLVLLSSSLAVTLALIASRQRLAVHTVRWMVVAESLGVVFLVIKGLEYWLDYEEGLLPGFDLPSPLLAPSARLFMNLYFLATALHAVHLAVAVVLVLVLVRRVRRHGLSEHVQSHLTLTGLYWHMVDGIWLVLFPMLYLVGR